MKQQISVKDLYYHAQRIVLYPSSVLLDVSDDSRPLRPAVVAALNRIFQLVDTDNDGVVNDAELNGFQERVFDATLSPEEIAGWGSLLVLLSRCLLTEKCPKPQ